MTVRHKDEYNSPEITRALIDRIKGLSRKPVCLMEVCGTHTMSIFRSGIRALLPEHVTLLSGPGCPVCVTSQRDIDSFINLAGNEDVIVATFGDLLRVPGTESSLQKERANGRDVRIVYSTLDALDIARKNPGRPVAFIGVGFETTAPTVAASILTAKEEGLGNYSVFSAHKLVPPALEALMGQRRGVIDGLILPGHVSTIIGVAPYLNLVEQYQIPCVVGGFEPVDILHAILMLIIQIESGVARLENEYTRAVTYQGNQKALKLMDSVFYRGDASWRGMGAISRSGLKIKREFASFDAQVLWKQAPHESKNPKGCICGDILKGVSLPTGCSLYKKVCTPLTPVGPCMVSSEGSCAAYFRYHD